MLKTYKGPLSYIFSPEFNPFYFDSSPADLDHKLKRWVGPFGGGGEAKGRQEGMRGESGGGGEESEKEGGVVPNVYDTF